MTAVEIIGYIGSVAMVFGYMPQAIHTMRTRNTDGIAMTTFLLMGIGSLAFAIQAGCAVADGATDMLGICVTNIITTISSAIISTIKIYNDFYKKKKK